MCKREYVREKEGSLEKRNFWGINFKLLEISSSGHSLRFSAADIALISPKMSFLTFSLSSVTSLACLRLGLGVVIIAVMRGVLGKPSSSSPSFS